MEVLDFREVLTIFRRSLHVFLSRFIIRCHRWIIADSRDLEGLGMILVVLIGFRIKSFNWILEVSRIRGLSMS